MWGLGALRYCKCSEQNRYDQFVVVFTQFWIRPSSSERKHSANKYSVEGKALFLITDVLEKYTHYCSSSGLGSPWQSVWGAQDVRQWPEAPFLSLISIWGQCGHVYLHCFVRRQECSGTERKQLGPGCYPPKAHTPSIPVPVLTLWENQIVFSGLQQPVSSTQIIKCVSVLINSAVTFASETV